MKKAVTLWLIVCFICLLFVGCNKEQDQLKEKQTMTTQTTSKYKFEAASDLPLFAKQNTKPILAPVEISTVRIENGISFEFSKFTDGKVPNNQYYQYFKINGLADKEVENKINQKIYDECVSLYNKGLPPYRGIRTIVTDDSEIKISSLRAVHTSNLANILSVQIIKDMIIQDKGKYSFGVNDVATLNFNLKNGEQIALSDLFSDNCDFKNIINNHIGKYIFSNNIYSEDKKIAQDGEIIRFSLVSPFKGINDNQKYYINGGVITILIDYNMPEFDTNYSCVPFSITYNEHEVINNVALFARFETNDESLYDSTIKRAKSFIILNEEMNKEHLSGNADILGLDYKNLLVSLTLEIPKKIENKELSGNFYNKFYNGKNKLINLINDRNALFPQGLMHTSYYYRVSYIGKYIKEEEVSLLSGKNIYKEQNYSFCVYDKKSAKKLILSDCFAKDFDYKKAIINTIIKKQNIKDKTEQEIMDFIEKSDFTIFPWSIRISETSHKGINPRRDYTLQYADLGYENLTIFD